MLFTVIIPFVADLILISITLIGMCMMMLFIMTSGSQITTLPLYDTRQWKYWAHMSGLSLVNKNS